MERHRLVRRFRHLCHRQLRHHDRRRLGRRLHRQSLQRFHAGHVRRRGCGRIRKLRGQSRVHGLQPDRRDHLVVLPDLRRQKGRGKGLLRTAADPAHRHDRPGHLRQHPARRQQRPAVVHHAGLLQDRF